MATRNDFIPSVCVKGSHYEVGHQVGLKFKDMIQSYMQAASKSYQRIFDFYNTDDGKRMYSDSLQLLKKVYPGYVEVIEGIASGAAVPFFKLFLLHLDAAYATNEEELLKHSKIGCSTILCNFPEQQLIGHNEDALSSALNHCYVVDAEITETNSAGTHVTKEKFMAFCYAGELPGFCMGCNQHGLSFSINVIQSDAHCGRIPRHFICRAMLSAKDFDQVLDILHARGYGVTDGIGINLGIKTASGSSLYSIEVGPNPLKNDESAVDVHEIKPNESYLHCNSFQRLNLPSPDNARISSQRREATYQTLQLPVDEISTLDILGNQSDPEYSFFREGTEPFGVTTVSTGIFHFNKGTWTLYSKNPKSAKPVSVYQIL